MHVIAAKAVCFKEALSDDFKVYQQGIIDNAQALCKGLMLSLIHICWGSGDGRAKGRKGKRMEGQGWWRKLFRSGRGDGGCGYKKEAGNLVGYLPRVLFCFKYFA